MQNIRQICPGVYQYHCLHFSPQELDDLKRIVVTIERDLQINGLRKRQIQNSLVIMNFLGESISAGMAQPLADTLRVFGARVAGVFMVPLDPTDYPAVTIPHWCANHSDWFTRFHRAYPAQFDLTTDRRIICLNRRHSPLRAQVARHLLDRLEHDEILLSHESLYVKPTARTRYLDGPVDERAQHRAPDQQWLRAATKLITEGNEQGMPNVPETVLVSEKTFKCFAWRQFPVWISVPGTVQAVRDMGFDVFDDLFKGHEYDVTSDQDQRVSQVLNLVTDFAGRPLHRLQDLRYRHRARLQSNYRRLRQLAQQREIDCRRAQDKFIKMFADNHPFRV